MAQTLKFGNGTWATKKGSTLAYNDEDGNFKPLPFTYTGAGKGTRVNKEGLIEVVENDRPRIDYLDGEDGVFLLEKAATNLIPYSEDFTSGWAFDDTTLISNSVISPDGTQNASTLIGNTVSSRHLIWRAITGYVDGSYSFFAKHKELRYLQITSANSTEQYANFDIKSGVIGKVGSAFSNAKIEDYGNGWYRCSVVSDNQYNAFYLSLVSDLNSTWLPTWSMANNTDGLYIWGAQVESGNVSSYIPTQGNSQTRVQETASGSGNSEVFNDSQGVLFADISYPITTSGSGNKRIAISNGTSSNRVMFAEIGNTGIGALITSGGVNSAYITGNVNNLLSFKSAIKYRQNDFSLWVNGFEVGTDTSGLVPVGLSELAFDGGDNSNPFYGKTKEISYYDTVLTDLELETLTSYRTWEAMVKELNLNIIHNE